MAGLFQGEQRRAMTIAAAGFGLVIVLFLGSRLLSGGGGEDPADDFAQPTPTTAPVGPTPPGTGGDETVPVIPIPELPDALEIRELRDPFTPPLQQILTERQLAGPPDSGQPSEPGEPGQPGEPGEPGEPGNGESGSPAARVTLRSVETDDEGEPFAVLDVDGTLFEAAEGETFGPDDEFAVASIDVEAECALLLFGDEPFTECVDETIAQK